MGNGNAKETGIVDKTRLRKFLTEKYTAEQLKVLCSDVEQSLANDGIDCKVNLDDIGGESLSVRVHNLIEYLDNRGNLRYLMNVVQLEYPNVIKDTEKIPIEKTYVAESKDDQSIYSEEKFVQTPEKKHKAGATRIILSIVVIIALIGFVIWWNNNNPTVKQVNGTTTTITKTPQPIHGGQIMVKCTSYPYTISPGDEAEIRVMALTEDNTPISGATVTISAGGGWFSTSKNYTEVGQTDSSGLFITKWRSPSPAASAYILNAEVSKDGFTSGSAECTVYIQ